MNTPYIKEFDQNGVCINPIIGAYSSTEPNRQQRRFKEKRFIGNGKNRSLTIVKQTRFLRVVQFAKIKHPLYMPKASYGGVRRVTLRQIQHYLEPTTNKR